MDWPAAAQARSVAVVTIAELTDQVRRPILAVNLERRSQTNLFRSPRVSYGSSSMVIARKETSALFPPWICRPMIPSWRMDSSVSV